MIWMENFYAGSTGTNCSSFPSKVVDMIICISYAVWRWDIEKALNFDRVFNFEMLYSQYDET